MTHKFLKTTYEEQIVKNMPYSGTIHATVYINSIYFRPGSQLAALNRECYSFGVVWILFQGPSFRTEMHYFLPVTFSSKLLITDTSIFLKKRIVELGDDWKISQY